MAVATSRRWRALQESVEARRDRRFTRDGNPNLERGLRAHVARPAWMTRSPAFEEARKGAIEISSRRSKTQRSPELRVHPYVQRASTTRSLAGSLQALSRAKIEAPRSISLAHSCIARCRLARREEGAEAEARLGVEHAPTSVIRMYAYAVLADTTARRATAPRRASRRTNRSRSCEHWHARGRRHLLLHRARGGLGHGRRSGRRHRSHRGSEGAMGQASRVLENR